MKAKYIINQYTARLSIHAPMSKADFITLYNTVHTIDDIDDNNDNEMTDNDDATDGSLYQHITGNALVVRQRDAHNNIVAPAGAEKIIECFEAVFVSSWTQHKTQKELNLVTLDLKKLSTRVFTTRTTAAATAAVDEEPAADKVELKALIQKETKSETKEMQKQLDSLKKQLEVMTAAKNISQRGRGGASKKQLNTPSTTAAAKPSSKKKEISKSVNRRDKKGKAEENNKGNANVKKYSKGKPGKPSSDTNKRNSNNARKTTKNGSRRK